MANPHFAVLPSIEAARCTGCGRCVAACPTQLLSLELTGWRKSSVLGDANACTGCAKCEAVCPFGAIEMVRESRVAIALQAQPNRV